MDKNVVYNTPLKNVIADEDLNRLLHFSKSTNYPLRNQPNS